MNERGWMGASCGILLAAVAGAAELTKSQTAVVEAVVQAQEFGDSARVVQVLSPVVASLPASQISRLDEALAAKSLPPCRKLLGETRLQAFEQQSADGLPAPGYRESAWTLDAVVQRVRGVLGERQTHRAFRERRNPPDSLDDFEALFWQMHVLNNRLLVAERLCEAAGQLGKKLNRGNAQSLPEEDRAALATRFDDLRKQLDEMMQVLRRRDVELRVDRLALATHVLNSPTAEMKLRLMAAHVVDLDGELLAERLREPALPKSKPQGNGTVASGKSTSPANEKPAENDDRADIRPRLTSAERAGLIDEAKFFRDQGRIAAGDDLLRKSRLLFAGLHWWFRGRYGAGTHGGGLLKAPAANSPQMQFALYMPTEPPKPTDPTALKTFLPRFDRRHHYLWQFETRNIVVVSRDDNLGTLGSRPYTLPQNIGFTSVGNAAPFY